MEHLIHNNEQSIPEPDRSAYMELLQILEKNKSVILDAPLQLATENLKIIREVLSKLKKRIINDSFLSPSDEILFFKITKPQFHSLLIEWSGIFDLELSRPLGGGKTEEKYIKKGLRKIKDFFWEHEDFFSYYRGGMTHSDERYFLRGTEELELDNRYTTGKDRLAALFLGYIRLQKYLENAADRLKGRKDGIEPSIIHTTLDWTASKAGLVELINGLHLIGVFNHGKAEIKAIANQFERLFQVDLGNFYHVFNEIRLRKKSRTPLIDSMKAAVIRKMDELDDR